MESWKEGDFGEDMIDLWERTQANHLGCRGDIGGNWSAHCITRWPWFTLCFVVCLSHAVTSRRWKGGSKEMDG